MTTGGSKYYTRYYTYIQPIVRLPIIKTYGTTILTLISMIIFIFFAIKPTVETILVLQKKLNDSKEVLNKITQKSEALTNAKDNYLNLDQKLKNRIHSAVPDKAELKTILQTLESTARTNNASISALQIQPLILEEKKEDVISNTLAEIAFTLNIEGSYTDLVNILNQLKNSTRLISIDKAIFNKAVEGQILLLSINGKAYYLK